MTQQAPPPLLFGPATLDPAFHSVAGGQWVEEELNLSHFRDQRIRKRVYRLVQQLAEHIGEPIPNACQDWANTKAAYRLLSNPRLTARGKSAHIPESRFKLPAAAADALQSTFPHQVTPAGQSQAIPA